MLPSSRILFQLAQGEAVTGGQLRCLTTRLPLRISAPNFPTEADFRHLWHRSDFRKLYNPRLHTHGWLCCPDGAMRRILLFALTPLLITPLLADWIIVSTNDGHTTTEYYNEPAKPGLMSLSATMRRGCSCSASYTDPMPPSPTRRRIR
jgi:hypothetical protein